MKVRNLEKFMSIPLNLVRKCDQAMAPTAFLAQKELLDSHVKSDFAVRNGNTLNYVEFYKKPGFDPLGKNNKTLVLMHGYAWGLGTFYKNYDNLLSYYDRIVAVDWLGMGLSARNGEKIKPRSLFLAFCGKPEDSVELSKQVTNQFVDSLHGLLSSQSIKNFTLAGHSMGGYLCGRYALKYPEDVNGLVLVSPVGVPLPPPDTQLLDSKNTPYSFKLLDGLSKLSVTPQFILRTIKSKDFMRRYLKGRFPERWAKKELELEHLTNYLYEITTAPPNGENALHSLFEIVNYKDKTMNNIVRTEIFARDPLQRDLCEFKKPILLMFGNSDWLYSPRAVNAVDLWRQNGSKLTKYETIEGAGHFIYFDNPDGFGKAVINWTKKLHAAEAKLEAAE